MLKVVVERRAISVFRYPRAGNEDGVIVVPASSAATAPTTPFVELDPETAAAAAVVKEDEGNQLQQELSQLRVLDEDQRAAIEECDMIGDFGSKVSGRLGPFSILLDQFLSEALALPCNS